MALSNWAVGIWKGGLRIGDTNELKVHDMTIRIIKDSIYADVEIGKNVPLRLKPISYDVNKSYLEVTQDKSNAPLITKIWVERFEAPYPRVYFLAKISDHARKVTFTEWACGIGTYGYSKQGHWVGVTNPIFKEFRKWVKMHGYPLFTDKTLVNLSSAVIGFKIGIKDKKLALIVSDKDKMKKQHLSLVSVLERKCLI